MTECQYQPIDGDSLRCPACGHERPSRGLRADQIHRHCPALGKPPAIERVKPGTVGAQADACVHRGQVLEEVRCKTCNDGEIFLPIYECAIHGRCSLGDYKKRSDKFAEVQVCKGCPSQKPLEPKLPSLVKRAYHFAGDKLTDVRAGRPRRSPERIREIFNTHCRPCPLYNAIEGACSHCGCPVSATEPEDNRIAWAALGCSADPPRWLPEATEPVTRRIFVLGHEPERMARLPARLFLTPVFLPELTPAVALKTSPLRLAENAIYTCDLLAASREAYLGCAAASWDEKYDGDRWKGLTPPRCLPLERLDELPLSPTLVWGAHLNDDPGVIAGLGRLVPGLLPLVDDALAHLGLERPTERGGLLASNFLAHRDVTLALAEFMRRAIVYLDGRYGPTWPLSVDPACPIALGDRLPAYVCEALTICWFASRADLTIKQIPST